jgi:hypothetical protein
MSDDSRQVDAEDLEEQNGQELPDREVMSIISPEPQPWPAADDGSANEPLKGPEAG